MSRIAAKTRKPKKNLSAKAISLLRKVAKHILAEPKRYDQHNWILKGSSILSKSAVHNYEDDIPRCGTVGCLAGWICVLTGSKTRTKHQEVAAAALGMPYKEGIAEHITDKLFLCVRYWPDTYRLAYENANGHADRAKAAANRIEHFISTDGAE